MSAREAIWLVARREIVERGREKSFWIGIAVTVVLIGAFILVPRLLGFGDPDEYTVGVADEPSAVLAAAAAEQAPQRNVALTVESFDEVAGAEAALAAEDLDAAIVGGDQVVVRADLPSNLEQVLAETAAAQRLAAGLDEAGVPPDEIGALLTPRPLPVRALEPDEAGADDGAGALAFFVVFILYGQLFGYGFTVASGIVEEKSTRVVEVILASIKPSHLLAGKVLGIGVLGLAQLLLIAALGLGLVLATGIAELPASAWPTIAAALGWFVIGYAFYAGAFAVVGALSSRMEELQNTAGPLTLSVFLALFFAFIALDNPDGTLARVGSFIPLATPMVMPVRVAFGAAAVWEIVATIVLMLVTTYAIIAFAARVYRGGVLHVRSNLKLADALRAER